MCHLLQCSASVYSYLNSFSSKYLKAMKAQLSRLVLFPTLEKSRCLSNMATIKRSYCKLYCLFVPQMRRHSCLFFLFCGIFLPGILGFPRINTSIDCDSLLPNYEAEPQKSAPPYIITVSFDQFEPGNEIQGK